MMMTDLEVTIKQSYCRRCNDHLLVIADAEKLTLWLSMHREHICAVDFICVTVKPEMMAGSEVTMCFHEAAVTA